MRDALRLFGERLIESDPWFLAPLSWIYAMAIGLRNRLYDAKWFSSSKVPCTVVSVGNIVAGGTGKTPFVLMLAKAFSHRRVAILLRGYGSIPDEAMLLAKRLPNVKIYVGRDRFKLAKEAARHAELIILDDGFQYRRLHRDFDIVLTREQKERYLPRGFLRDSPKRLQRADAVFTDRELKLNVKRILSLKGCQVPSIRDWKVAIFCGIARPKLFKKTVEELGAVIVAEKRFADHGVIDCTKLPKAQILLCTEKDAVKLSDTDLPIYFLEMEMEVVRGRDRWEKLIEKIDQKIDNRPAYD